MYMVLFEYLWHPKGIISAVAVNTVAQYAMSLIYSASQ